MCWIPYSNIRPEDSDKTGDESEVCLDEILVPEDTVKKETAPLYDSSRNNTNRNIESPE